MGSLYIVYQDGGRIEEQDMTPMTFKWYLPMLLGLRRNTGHLQQLILQGYAGFYNY